MPLEISGITWILSYRCNLNCQHCFFDVRGPDKVLDPDLARIALSGLEQARPLAWQHVSGGEPLLFKSQLYELLETIQEHGTANVGVATNGFWGADEVSAAQIVSDLKERGVNGVCLSADGYHQNLLPLEYVITAAEQVAKKGLEKHSFVVSCMEDGCESIIDDAESPLPVAKVAVRKIGRGASIDRNKAVPEIPGQPCRDLCCCLGETSPFQPQMVWIDPYGHVMICYGLVIGNVNDQSLSEILRNYSVESSPVLNTLAEKGPIGLYRLAIDSGWVPEQQEYADECDLCWQSRNYLRQHYQDSLRPEECYPQNPD